jgi:hypothetical protein
LTGSLLQNIMAAHAPSSDQNIQGFFMMVDACDLESEGSQAVLTNVIQKHTDESENQDFGCLVFFFLIEVRLNIFPGPCTSSFLTGWRIN